MILKDGLLALVLHDTLVVYAAGTARGDRLKVHRFIGISDNASGSIIIILYSNNSVL